METPDPPTRLISSSQPRPRQGGNGLPEIVPSPEPISRRFIYARGDFRTEEIMPTRVTTSWWRSLSSSRSTSRTSNWP